MAKGANALAWAAIAAALAAADAAEAEKFAGCEFVPYAETVGAVPASVPTGCPEFEVVRPRRSGPVVRAVDFGLSTGRTDNAAAINRALEECRRVGAARLELAPGRYRCHGEGSHVIIENMSDFTLDGMGAELEFCRPSRLRPEMPQFEIDQTGGNVAVSNCERTVIRNFKMDWAWNLDPLADFGRVESVHAGDGANGSWVEVRLSDLDRHPKYPGPVPLLNMAPMREDRTNIAGNGHKCVSGYAEGHFGSRTEWIAPNLLRVWPAVKKDGANYVKWYDGLFSPEKNRRIAAQYRPGEFVRILHYYYGQNGFNLTSNTDLTIEDVEIWACRGMAYQVKGKQRRWQVLRCTVALPPHLKGKRAITATADPNHIVQSCGWCKFEDCRWELNMDDTNNFHDRTTVGRKSGANRIELLNVRGNAFFEAKPGEKVGLLEADFSRTGWSGTVTAAEDDAITFDREVPDGKGECLILFKSEYATDNVIFRRCDFTDGFGRNLLQSRNVTIEDCIFRRTTGAPLGFTSVWTYTAWCEGTGAGNVAIRNCIFDSTGGAASIGGIPCEIFTGARPRRPTMPEAAALLKPGVRDFVTARLAEKESPKACRGAVSGVLVENCRFVNPHGLVWHAYAGENLVFRNNTIEVTGSDRHLKARRYRGACHFESRDGLHASGNRFATTMPGECSGGFHFGVPAK